MASMVTLELGPLLESGIFSDLTITCQGYEFRVHKVILCAQSEYFRKLLTGPFKEANSDTIDFPEDDPYDLEMLIYFLYNSRLHYGGDQDAIYVLELDVRLYMIADKYDVAPVRTHMLQRLGDGRVFRAFDAEKCLTPQDEARQLGAFVDFLRYIDASTHDDTLWNLVLPVVEYRLAALLTHETFKKLLLDLPAVNLKLLKWVSSKKDLKNVQESAELRAAKRTILRMRH
ncbi:hypothetical protein Q7P37_008158 [Cladosporium fusiforme]